MVFELGSTRRTPEMEILAPIAILPPGKFWGIKLAALTIPCGAMAGGCAAATAEKAKKANGQMASSASRVGI